MNNKILGNCLNASADKSLQRCQNTNEKIHQKILRHPKSCFKFNTHREQLKMKFLGIHACYYKAA